MIDTHCHLTDSRLESQLESVIQRATLAGVSRIITIGTGIEDSRRCLAVAKGRENVRCVVGVHPNHAHEEDVNQLPLLREMQADASVVAIGEAGLDYHYGKEHQARQFEVFEFQLQLATEVNKPMVIHCREAMVDCLPMIVKYPKVRAVFHCFTGTLDEAKRVIDAGYYLGFTGPITFKTAGELRDVVKYTPMDRLLVETDAPWLTPEPMRRQKTNEPAMTMYVAAMVAQLKGVSIEEVDRLTTENASRLFGWP